MKKIYTVEEVFEALTNSDSLEAWGDGSWHYYLHIDEDGNFVSNKDNAVETFVSEARYVKEYSDELDEEYEDDRDMATDVFWENVYDFESKDNEDFMEVVEDLTEQVNEFWKEYCEENFEDIA